jgi:hypothetical protein
VAAVAAVVNVCRGARQRAKREQIGQRRQAWGRHRKGSSAHSAIRRCRRSRTLSGTSEA